ncbi:carboxymuconolactone decarboxylase family protein [Kosakonia sp. BK9b]
MSNRINIFQLAPALIKSLSDASQASHDSSLDSSIKDLVDIRASQLNGCTFCLDMHVKQARIHGERELRLYHLAVWRESPLFTAKERAALALTESLTRPSEHGVTDTLYREVREHFSEVELSELTFAIAIINSWNRVMLLQQTAPGTYDSAYGLERAQLQ